MSFSPIRFGPLHFLLIVNLVLAAGLAWMWVDEHGQSRNFAWVAPKAIAPDIKVPASPIPTSTSDGDASAYAIILERPLFAPDRRPPPPPAPPPPPDPMANIQILGIFSGANAGVLARVDGKTRSIRINEAVGAWKLKSIVGRDVMFAQGEDQRKLRLTYSKLDTPAPPQVTAVNPNPAGIPAANPAPAPVPGAVSPAQKAQDEVRERLRRRNELRAERGLPPVSD